MTVNPRLADLLACAEQGPAALAEAAAGLLAAWPADIPSTLRPMIERLLAKAAATLDDETGARLRATLHADPALLARVLPRRPAAQTLLAGARQGAPMVPRLAEALGVSQGRAAAILADPSGHALAAACKALGLERAVFSALAMLVLPGPGSLTALDAFDAIEAADAPQALNAVGGESLPHAAE